MNVIFPVRNYSLYYCHDLYCCYFNGNVSFILTVLCTIILHYCQFGNHLSSVLQISM